MPNKLKYAAKLQIIPNGGLVSVEGNEIIFENCDSFTILFDARTNYNPDFYSDWRGADPMPVIENELARATDLSYKKLLERHIQDITRLTKSANIEIGNSDAATLALPIDVRLKKYAAGGTDPDLEETMFQYGRYLLISSSRPGGLPANLQGLWNDSNTPPWSSDYHTNINIQMNYWPAEPANLAECHLPLLDLIVAMQEPSRKATQAAFGKVRGWTARTSHNIFGGHGWQWNIPASAWYAQHFWEHWAFGLDDAYLREVAYPVIKEVCQFWEDSLKVLPDGTLVVPNGWSPEHGPREDGVAHDQQIVWDLFTSYVEASAALGVDEDYRKRIAQMRDRLAGPKVGRWGQLQEWMADRDDPKDDHRHTSHLFALYPGRQISMTRTPEWARAARTSLEARGTSGDSRREWAWAWRCAMWARLREGEKAHEMIRNLLLHNTLDNLFGNHPPMQMDGNFGITGAIGEMLLQSHAEEIDLLPALPKAWPNGRITGLRARGNLTVDLEWKEGKAVHYRVTGPSALPVKVRVNGEVKVVTPTPN
jgi:alpha-L-fucosidase 2